MKSRILFFLLVICLNAAAFAQQKEDNRENFNGTWILDKDKSSNYGKFFDNHYLIISFNDNQFKITKVFVVDKKAASYELKLLTDKSGEKNTYIGLGGNVERNSKTYWQRNSLISEYKLKPEKEKLTFGGTERYYLSKDGQKLFVEIMQTSPAMPLVIEDLIKSRLVFQRKKPKTST
jgi:hypothetical protein